MILSMLIILQSEFTFGDNNSLFDYIILVQARLFFQFYI